MKNQKLLFWPNDNLNSLWWIVQGALVVFFIYIFITKLIVNKLISVSQLAFILLYFIGLISLFLITRLKLFRKYVEISDSGMKIKKHALKAAEKVDWSDIDQIDMQQFEPVIHYNGNQYMFTMQYEQTKALREMLNNTAKEKGINSI